MSRLRLLSVPLVFGLLSIVIACSPTEDPADLTDRTWKLIEFGEAGAMNQAVGDATAMFELGTVSGSTGCNSYSGEYSIDGDSMSIGPVAATERACMDPPGIMEQESVFLRILSAVTKFEVSGNELRLESASGLLVFGR